MGLSLTGVLGFITGLPIKAVTDALTKVKIEKLKLAGSESAQIHDERLKELDNRLEYLLNLAKDRIFLAFLIFLSLPAALILWQYIVIDKIIAPGFGGHKTDSLSPEMWDYVYIVLGFWFLRGAIDRIKK
jgi:hypothetical protein